MVHHRIVECRWEKSIEKIDQKKNYNNKEKKPYLLFYLFTSELTPVPQKKCNSDYYNGDEKVEIDIMDRREQEGQTGNKTTPQCY